MFGDHPFQGLDRYAGGGPRGGVTGGDHARVAETGFQARTRLAINHRDLVPGARQIPGAGDPDNTATQNHYVHACLLSRRQIVIVLMDDIAILKA